MADLSKLNVALCQLEVVEGRPSCYEGALRALLGRVRSTGAHLVVVSPDSFESARPRLYALNGAVLAEEDRGAQIAVGDELYRIGFGFDAAPDECDLAVASSGAPWTLASGETSRGKSDSQFVPPTAPLVTGSSPFTPGLSGLLGMTGAPGALGASGAFGASEAPDAASAKRAGSRVPLVLANPVGMANRDKRVMSFDGGSSVFGADGACLARLRDDFAGDFSPVFLTQARKGAQPCEMKLLTAIVSTMRRFDAQVLPWAPKWIIGLSGGLDSSVVAALLVLAFGSARVVGYNLATRYNSDATKANAARLAEALDIELRNGSIEQLVDATGATLSQYGYSEDAMGGLVLENVQARVRGHMLSTFAAVEGGVIANNGNRVESAIGYATLYGDAIGALAPIGDITKVQLFGLSRQINEVIGTEAIPENLLPHETDDGYEWQTMPSAELADGQRDPMKWFYHDWLISTLLDETAGDPLPIMERYQADRLASLPVSKWVKFYGLDDPQAFVDDLEWVMRQMRNAAFKRIQAPPAIRLASFASIAPTPEIQGAHDASEAYLQLRTEIINAR